MICIEELGPYVCAPTLTIREVLERIDGVSPHLFQIVTDASGRVLGTVTDGDIRRAMLMGKSLESTVAEAMHAPPKVGHMGQDIENRKGIRNAKFLPVIDSKGILCSIMVGALANQSISRALVMAGGFGRRLGERTRNVPKPLLTVGERPILDHVLGNLEDAGVARIDIAVHYLADQVEAFVRNRDNHADINILHEKEPMGTAGALALIGDSQGEPLFVVNGDVICRVDFRALNDFHLRHGNDGTIAVARYDVSVPFGVVEHGQDGQFSGIREKPVFSHFVAAGIYCLSPAYLAIVSRDRAMDMPDLLAMGRQVGLFAGLFPIHEYWKDVGHPDDLKAADQDHVTSG